MQELMDGEKDSKAKAVCLNETKQGINLLLLISRDDLLFPEEGLACIIAFLFVCFICLFVF